MHGDRGTYFPASPCLHPLVFFFFMCLENVFCNYKLHTEANIEIA